VRIRAVGDSGGSNRLGQVSPVLARVAYTFARSPRAPALPSRVQLTWSDAAGHEHSAVVGIADLLAQATGAEDETLGFVILRDGTAFAQLSSTTTP
jgi:hypothetical protein